MSDNRNTEENTDISKWIQNRLYILILAGAVAAYAVAFLTIPAAVNGTERGVFELFAKFADVTRGVGVIIIAIAVGFFAYRQAGKKSTSKPSKTALYSDWRNRRAISGMQVFVLIVMVCIIAGLLTVIGGTWGDVGVGYESVIVNTWNNTITPGPTGPVSRPFVVSPFTEHLVPIYVAVTTVHFCSGYDINLNEIPGSLTAGCDQPSPVAITSDGIRLAFDMNIVFTLNNNTNAVLNLYHNYPNLDYTARVIVPTVTEVVRNVIVNETFNQVFANRAEIASSISNNLVSDIANNPTLKGSIIIQASFVQVLNINMPQPIQTQLQAEKNSQIGIQIANNNLNQTIINANAARQAAILQAEGQAQAKIIAANATKEAILTVLESVGCPSSNSTCQQQASQLYLELLTYQQIAQTSPNTLFIIGTSGNSSYIVPLPGSGNVASSTSVEGSSSTSTTNYATSVTSTNSTSS